MHNISISIIIPIYKVESYIVQCVESVLNQTYRNLEVILVDDSSPDNSMEMARDCIEQSRNSKDLKFIYLYHNKNRGLSAARNTGMEAANGNYFFFLDSDDTITNDCIEKLARPLNDESYDLVVGNTLPIGGISRHESLKLKLGDGLVLRGKAIQDTYILKWNMMAQNKLYRKEFLSDKGLFFKEGLIHEDELWSIQIAALAESMTAVNEYTYNYYIRNSGITAHSAGSKKVIAIEIVVNEASKFLRERHIFSKPLYKVIFGHIEYVLKAYLGEKAVFIKAYQRLKENPYLPIWVYFVTYGFHIRMHLRNLHYLLPATIGANYLYNRMVKDSK